MAEMSPLRRRMIEDMTVRNLSPATQQSYIHAVAKFSRYFGRSPDRLGLEDVHAFQVHLISTGISWASLNQIVCALRFFYGVTLRQDTIPERIPYARQPRKLPVVRFLEAVSSLKSRAALTTAYAAGLLGGGRHQDRRYRQPAHGDPDRRRSKASRCRDRTPRRSPHLGPDPDASSPCPLRRSGRRLVARRAALGQHAARTSFCLCTHSRACSGACSLPGSRRRFRRAIYASSELSPLSPRNGPSPNASKRFGNPPL